MKYEAGYFFSLSILSYFHFRNTAIERIEEIGINSRYFPKHFIAPKRWMRSFFNIRQRLIPRFIYVELYLSLFFLLLGPINLVICIAADGDRTIASILGMLQICLALIAVIYDIVMEIIYKRK